MILSVSLRNFHRSFYFSKFRAAYALKPVSIFLGPFLSFNTIKEKSIETSNIRGLENKAGIMKKFYINDEQFNEICDILYIEKKIEASQRDRLTEK